MSSFTVREINEKVQAESYFTKQLISEISKVIVGQEYLIERLLIALLTDGHVLIEGVPGLAKTLTVRTLAECIQVKFQRIQFTPDLLPADLIGTLIFDLRENKFFPKKGPIFSQLILADEINRAPAKVQSALLEAMQERQVTLGDTTYPLDDPFLVLATQNPIEQEGTYPLPEAQVDRFMLKLRVHYPLKDQERQILDRMTSAEKIKISPVAQLSQLRQAKNVIEMIYMDEKIKNYIVNIVYATRTPQDHHLGEIKTLIQYGASPRGTIYLAKAARAHAFIRGRGFVIPEDIKVVGPDILRHRIITTFEAEAEEITSDDLVKKIFETVEVP